MRDPSQTQMSSLNDDEIDLRELFGALWRGKIVIMLCVIMAIALAAFYLRTAERRYTVRYVFAPIEADNSGPNLGGLGGFASLAGISLPSSTSSDFIKFKFLLTSEEVATQLLKNDKLTKSIFASEWDAASASFRKPPDSPRAPYIRAVKKLLTGQDASDYVSPNSARLSDWLSEEFSTSEDRETGFLTLSAETPEPELIKEVISQATEETDRLLKDRFIASAEQTIGFYHRQLAQARAREYREALAKLIATEDQKLMLASKGSYFVAEPVSEPYVSINPTSPKASLVLALSVVLGSFFGAALVLIRKALKK